MSVLDDDGIRAQLSQAWKDSQPGTGEAHEEGGFVLQGADGSLVVERWPKGLQNEIVVPEHPGGKYGNQRIVATFHTHPNVGQDYQQEPSLTDIRAVRDDPDLHHPGYDGEYVISHERLYRIRPDGQVDDLGDRSSALLGGV
jgi:hypothetical protein